MVSFMILSLSASLPIMAWSRPMRYAVTHLLLSLSYLLLFRRVLGLTISLMAALRPHFVQWRTTGHLLRTFLPVTKLARITRFAVMSSTTARTRFGTLSSITSRTTRAVRPQLFRCSATISSTSSSATAHCKCSSRTAAGSTISQISATYVPFIMHSCLISFRTVTRWPSSLTLTAL